MNTDQNSGPQDSGARLRRESFLDRLKHLIFHGVPKERLSAAKELASIRDNFRFLRADFGFAEDESRSGSDEIESKVVFLGKSSGVIVNLSDRLGVTVQVARLVDSGQGKDLPREDMGYGIPAVRNVYELREILKHRPGASADFDRLHNIHGKRPYPEVLVLSAELLRKHAGDVLEGDFSFFEPLNVLSQEAIQRMRDGGVARPEKG